MGRKVRTSRGKTMKPNFFVFCEGETEVAYVKFLRSLYRVPIQIIPRKSDSNISGKYIESCMKDYVTTENDRTFLMFDLDVDGMLERLQRIKGAVLLVSNPCIELWLLLHYEECKSELSASDCIKRLMSHSGNYSKGKLTESEKQILARYVSDAISRAKGLREHRNPSTTVYRLIESIVQYI